ncbi:MAG: nucleotidyltransferase domain-containing protein [Spirochaetaceae bacterium]|jgi:predicted nucleotidyltransferase|nr:nucleotidyltransferase domain-containing protein [Spirochaetaceae bacterium]
MAESFGLSEYTIKTIQTLLQKYRGIQKVVIYGSRAKGDYRPGSDIDISLYTDSGFTRDDLARLRCDFDDSDMPYFVDVSIFSDLTTPALREHITRLGKPLLE